MRIFVDCYERKTNPYKPGTAEYAVRALQIALGGEYKITRYPQPKGDLEPTNLIADWEAEKAYLKRKRG